MNVDVAAIERTVRDQAELLEALSDAVRSLSAGVSASERRALEARLGPGALARAGLLVDQPSGEVQVATPGMPASGAVGSVAASNYLGNVVPFIGQRNVLADPVLQDFLRTTPQTVESTGGSWFHTMVASSGVPPASRIADVIYKRGSSGDNPFNTNLAGWRLGMFFVGTTDLYVRPQPFAPGSIPTLPYLVASVRVARLVSEVLTGITSVTVKLDLLSGASAPTTVEASSEEMSWTALPTGSQRQLVAAAQRTEAQFRATSWWWRLKVRVVSAGEQGSLAIDWAEPMLHFAYTPDPIPFSPVIGSWESPEDWLVYYGWEV